MHQSQDLASNTYHFHVKSDIFRMKLDTLLSKSALETKISIFKMSALGLNYTSKRLEQSFV